jgi:hypothetical protein
MAIINFPSSPTDGQVFTVGSYIYTYNSAKTAWLGTVTPAEGGSGGGGNPGQSIMLSLVYR